MAPGHATAAGRRASMMGGQLRAKNNSQMPNSVPPGPPLSWEFVGGCAFCSQFQSVRESEEIAILGMWIIRAS